jgi:hypothetical protein
VCFEDAKGHAQSILANCTDAGVIDPFVEKKRMIRLMLEDVTLVKRDQLTSMYVLKAAPRRASNYRCRSARPC